MNISGRTFLEMKFNSKKFKAKYTIDTIGGMFGPSKHHEGDLLELLEEFDRIRAEDNEY